MIDVAGGPKVVAASPRGRPIAVGAADTERILAGCRRFGPVTFSAGVADCLAIPAVLGLPCDPAHAGPKLAVPEAGSLWRLVARGTPFDGALVVWNDELRNLMTIPEDAEWIAVEGLAPHDVAAINAAVHDFFEVAFSEELVVRFGR